MSQQPPKIDEVRRKLQPWLTQHTRPAWKPLVQAREISLPGSKFCGTPMLARGERWPTCGVCKSNMPLFLQLNSHNLPREFGQPFSGLLQFFYCVSGECEAEAWEPFERNKLLRVVQPTEDADPLEIPDAFDDDYPCRSITGWEKMSDLPSTAEHEELGLKYDFDFKQHKMRLECQPLALVIDQLSMDIPEAIANAHHGDKLGGWPKWVQGVEYPECPKCSKRMRYLFQIDSEDNVPYMWGDVGIGHITQCPDHPDMLGFGWACS